MRSSLRNVRMIISVARKCGGTISRRLARRAAARKHNHKNKRGIMWHRKHGALQIKHARIARRMRIARMAIIKWRGRRRIAASRSIARAKLNKTSAAAIIKQPTGAEKKKNIEIINRRTLLPPPLPYCHYCYLPDIVHCLYNIRLLLMPILPSVQAYVRKISPSCVMTLMRPSSNK